MSHLVMSLLASYFSSYTKSKEKHVFTFEIPLVPKYDHDDCICRKLEYSCLRTGATGQYNFRFGTRSKTVPN